MSEVYQFSIDDFQNDKKSARLYIAEEYAINLVILAATTIKDNDFAKEIVKNAYADLFNHRQDFTDLNAIKDFLYDRVNEDCQKYLNNS